MSGRGSTSPDRLRPIWSGAFLVRLVPCLLVLIGSGACARAEDKAPPPIETFDDLSAALRRAGAQVQVSSTADGPVLGVPARPITVGGVEILVYEYATVEDRQAVSASISVDPRTIYGTPLNWPETPRVWVSGRLIVVYPGQDGGTIVLLNGLLGDPLSSGESEVDEPYPPAVAVAIEALALKLEVHPASIRVSSFDAVEWPDACLSLPEANESCAEVVTPGWRVELLAGETDYEAHTDLLGTQVRLR